MQCEGMFKFKGITHVDSGSFKNDRGEEIQYKESYKLKVDEMTPQGIFERVFRLPSDSSLIPVLMKFGVYDDIHLLFDVMLYASGCRIIPVGVKNLKQNSEEKPRTNN